MRWFASENAKPYRRFYNHEMVVSIMTVIGQQDDEADDMVDVYMDMKY